MGPSDDVGTSPGGARRVAVVGTGAWGTTLALIVARNEPVILLSHSAETAEHIGEDAAQREAPVGDGRCRRTSS